MDLCGYSVHEKELYYLRKNMRRDDFEIACMEDDFAWYGGCCPGCRTGGKHTELLNRQDRRKEREKVLEAKIARYRK